MDASIIARSRLLFEPTPIVTTRHGRLRGLVAVTIPVALLVGVVGVAVIGSPGPITTGAGEGAVAANVVPSPAGVPQDPASAPARDTATLPAIRFPLKVFDLSPRSVGDALADREGVEVGSGLVSVRGWLSLRPERSRCAPSSGARAFTEDLCWSTGILRDDATPSLEWVDGTLRRARVGGVHVHPQFPPGVSLWGLDAEAIAQSDDRLTRGSITPIPVVLIGRFGDPRVPDCDPGGRHCGETFVAERVAWAAGQWRTRPVVQALEPIRAGLDATESRQVAFRAFPGPTIVLSQALLPASLLDRLDPTAATATAVPGTASRDADRLWYLRLMLPAPNELGPERSLRWIAIDDVTGAILGTEAAP